MRKVKKSCLKCKHHIAEYDFHDFCLSHRACFSVDNRLLTSAECSWCDLMWENELKILGDKGASAYDTHELKWGQVIHNGAHKIRAAILKNTGVKTTISRDAILSTADLVR